MFKSIISWVEQFATQAGLSSHTAMLISNAVSVLALILISLLAFHITWKIITRLVIPIINKSKTSFDDLLQKHHFFKRIAYFSPALMLYYLLDDALGKNATPDFILKLLDIWMVLISILIIDSILSTIRDYYRWRGCCQ
jgi:miniconductance mechanosensitive channel